MKIGVVMDPISSIKIKKDSTFAMLLEGQAREHELFYMEQGDLLVRDGVPLATLRPVAVKDDPAGWYELGEPARRPLSWLDVILMRKDPPFNMEYIYTTYILELAELAGVLVVNRPASLRDANEKAFTAWFPDCSPPTLITRNANEIKDFISEKRDVVLKPLDGFGGISIFRLPHGDPNTNVVIETLTGGGTRFAMVQEFLPQISEGDKRVLLVDGEPVPYALARIPMAGESRGNLAAGGAGEGRPLGERERWICQRMGPELRRRGLLFVGLDIIGDQVTEINVTCPTCIRELDQIYGLNIAGTLLDCVEARLAAP